MSSIASIALSGLQAAVKRVAVSADNLVNARTGRPVEVEGTTPKGVFEPREVVQISLENGGVRAEVRPVTPATQLVGDADSPTGAAAFPNVDLATEIVNQRLAVRDYKASIRILETENEMFDALLDIKS